MFWTLCLLVLACLAQVWISLPLWWSEAGRSFPTWGLDLPGPQAFWAGLALVGLLALPWLWRRKPKAVGLSLALILPYVLSDLLRLQVWLWLYFLMMIWAMFADPHSPKQQQQGLLRLFAAMYVWTGIYKLNPHFCDSVFSWWVGIYAWTQPLENHLNYGYAVGLIEVLLGLGLLLPKVQKIAAWSLIIMHLSILSFLIKDDWNHVVYPWNVFMIILLAYWSRTSFEGALSPWPRPAKLAAALFLLLGPAAYSLGYYPYALSFTMYSGMAGEWHLLTKDLPQGCGIEAFRSEFDYRPKTKEHSLLLDDWTMKELQVPTFVSPKMKDRLLEHFCPCLGQGGKIEWQQARFGALKTDTLVFDCATH